MSKDCGCSKKSAESIFTGMRRIHVTEKMYNSPLAYLESLGDGVHTFVRVQKYRVEKDGPLVDIRLALLEVDAGVWIRRASATYLAKCSTKLPRSGAITAEIVADTQPFNVHRLTLEFGNIEKNDATGVMLLPLHIHADLRVVSSKTRSIVDSIAKQTLLMEEHLASGCFGVEYGCGHDECHTLCISHNCNYHCISRICNNNGQCGDWQNAGPSCDPLTCHG